MKNTIFFQQIVLKRHSSYELFNVGTHMSVQPQSRSCLPASSDPAPAIKCFSQSTEYSEKYLIFSSDEGEIWEQRENSV